MKKKSETNKIIQAMLNDLAEQFANKNKDEFSDTCFRKQPNWTQAARRHTKPDGTFLSKQEVIRYVRACNLVLSPQIKQYLKLKPVRSLSGVVPVTIFTKPYTCSGHCIFCPTEPGVPQSYLSDEPGIQRALVYKFDPWQQVLKRIEALWKNYHNTEKVELIISGGTWNDYEQRYRLEYMVVVFQALNQAQDQNVVAQWRDLAGLSTSALWAVLAKEQKLNESAKNRAVGISIETRPDKVTLKSIGILRRMGITKVQLGVQSLDDRILKLNNRGHGVKETYCAIRLLRRNGFKVQIHWMCNLYGSILEKDARDFVQLFEDKRVRPDELKVYPCSVVKGTKLYKMWQNGEYTPYSTVELIELMIKCKQKVPKYCRISRLFRDIPSQLIEAGNKKTNLRQMVQTEMKKRGLFCECIRCREIRGDSVLMDNLEFNILKYEVDGSTEYFLSFLMGLEYAESSVGNGSTPSRLVGFLRLSILSQNKQFSEPGEDRLESIRGVGAMIRELHVYGSVVGLGKHDKGAGQHIGLGAQLIEEAVKIAWREGVKRLGVIASVGTRDYYRKHNFKIEKRYGYGMRKL